MSCLGSNYNPPIKRTWSRLDNSCIYSPRYDNNNIINKQNILNYPNNSNSLTKSQIYSLMCKGKWIYKNKTWATQSINYTNPNINNLVVVNKNTLLCKTL